MILWFIDRFGLPGHYHRIWARLLRDNHVPPSEVRVISLHAVLKRTLLQKHGTRKAPTWVPDETRAIIQAIDYHIEMLKPRAVVLASPESLACLGLHPDFATLQSLRGSVYWRSDLPHLVMLPMSAWNSLVSQKEIGAANYGFESQDAFTAGQQGAIHQTHGSASSNAVASGSPIVGCADSGDRAGMGQRGGTSEANRGNGSVPRAGRNEVDSLVGHHVSPNDADTGRAGSRRSSLLPRGADSSQSEGADELGNVQPVRTGTDLELPSQIGGLADRQQLDSTGEAGAGEQSDRDGTDESEDPGTGPEDRRADGLAYRDRSLRAGEDGHGESDNEDEAESVDDDEPEPGDVDQFFYEPVLSPVGRFVLTADTQKLSRILRDGKNAAGPSRPIELNWR